ncbi:MAG: SpoIIE family protein phosphatase [Streptosporangiales bacterium]|nr:SpoIIE family protein phosphatase [Streptosporangiales bacterium]
MGVPAAGVLDEAPFGLAYLDRELRFVWANAYVAALVDRTPADLTGQLVTDVFAGTDAEAEQVVRAVLAGKARTADHLLRWPARYDPAATYAYHLVFFAAELPDGADGLGVLVTEATEEVEASSRLAIATERLHLLSDLAGQMSATFDVDRIVELTADLVLPVLGDACAVDVLEDDDPMARRVTRASSTHAPHGPSAASSRTVTSAAEIAPPPPVARVLTSGTLLRFPLVPAGLVDDADSDRQGNAVVVPMRARGQVVGAISLARFGSTRGYTPDEIAFAVEAAGRIGVALDNARLFEAQRDVASTLQHALLPQRLPQLPGIEVAARYIAGSAHTEVGGDWYDVTPLPDGKLALVIGDVMGRGVRAAAVMGQLRAAVRAYTVLNLSPGELLTHLDQVVASLDDVQLVTCLYGVLDPQTRAFTYARAGHHSPLLREADGTVRTLDSPSAPPLGLLDMVDGSPAEYATTLPPRSTLLLYTDGLVEERAIDPGIRHVQLAEGFTAGTGTSTESTVETVLLAMGRTGEHSDDIAVVAVHLAGAEQAAVDEPTHAHFTVTDVPESVSAARTFLTNVLDDWHLGSLVDTAALLVSETVTNALLHARSTADIQVWRTATGIEVEVRDRDDRLPAPRTLDLEAESGRGLRLLDELSAAWGAEPSDAGKRVWFRLDVTNPPEDRD